VKQNRVSFGTAATVRLRIRSTYLSRLLGNGGVFEACGNVGVNYEFGQSVGQDFAKAAALYKKACDGDVENGCGNL
jgi:uncharacterized protein